MSGVRQQSNFSQLKAHDEQLEGLGLLAERYFVDEPNTCLLKLRQLAEAMAQSVAWATGSRCRWHNHVPGVGNPIRTVALTDRPVTLVAAVLLPRRPQSSCGSLLYCA
jgi:hypothetical protein